MTELLSEITSKLMLLINSVDRGNHKTHQLLQCILEELKTKETTKSSSKLPQSVTENSNKVAQAVTEGKKSIEKSNATSNRLLSEVKTIREGMPVLWQNTLKSRKQAFWQYYRVQHVFQIFSQLLENEPPKMPRSFLPRLIRNEDAEETEIPQALAIEKFKIEINLQKIRLEIYRERFSKIDAIMITKFTTKYSNGICDRLLKQWENDCKR